MFKKIFLTIVLLLCLVSLGWCAGKGTNWYNVDKDAALNDVFNNEAEFKDVVAESITIDGTPIEAGEVATDSIVLENGETITNAVDDTVEVASGDSNVILSVKSPYTTNGYAAIDLIGDNGADVNDGFQIMNAAGGTLTIGSDSSVAGTYVTKLSLAGATGLVTTTGDVVVAGTTPQVTIGDAGEENDAIVFDGYAQDYYIALQDSSDDLLIGLGNAVGTTPALGIDENLAITTYGDITMTGTTPTLTIGDGGNEDNAIVLDGQSAKDFYVATDNADDSLIIGVGSTIGTDSRITVQDNTAETRIELGDAAEEDTVVVLDGNEADFYMALDDTDNDLKIGVGSTVDTTPAITIYDTTQNVDLEQAVTIKGALTAQGAIGAGYEMVTTSAADPGLGTASVTKLFTAITSDATGSAADVVSLAAGAAGQMKVIELSVDAETSGTSISADFEGATAAALLEDAGDTLILISDGTEWHIISNNGATLS